MLKALLATAATAAASAVAYRLYKSGRLDSLIEHFGPQLRDQLAGLGLRTPPSLDSAFTGANASKPAPAHPWPVDKNALGSNIATPDAA